MRDRVFAPDRIDHFMSCVKELEILLEGPDATGTLRDLEISQTVGASTDSLIHSANTLGSCIATCRDTLQDCHGVSWNPNVPNIVNPNPTLSRAPCVRWRGGGGITPSVSSSSSGVRFWRNPDFTDSILTKCEKECNPSTEGKLSDDCVSSIKTVCEEDMNNDTCITFCKRLGADCDSIIKSYCADLYDRDPQAAMDQSEICGCFMPQEFYDTYFESLREQLGTLPSAVSQNPLCGYAPCAASVSAIRPTQTDNIRCPDIQACFTDFTIENNGQITNLQTEQVNECISNNEVTPTTTTNTPNGGGTTTTSDPDGDSAEGLSTAEIVGIVVGSLVALGLVIGLIYFFARRRSKVSAV